MRPFWNPKDPKRILAALALILAIDGSAAAAGTFDASGAWIDDPQPAPTIKDADKSTPLEAEPLDYNRMCAAFGPGFVAAAGSTTCVKIGGYVKMGTSFGHSTFGK